MYRVSDFAVRRTVAEQVAPLTELHDDLAVGWPRHVEPAVAAARMRSGRVAYDPEDVIAGAGSLVVPYVKATVALERAGLATDQEAIQARERRAYVSGLVRAWLAGEPMPRERPRAVARRAAGLVASSILRAASARIGEAVGPLTWTRTYCPCCGGTPDFSVRASDSRSLVCARCDTRWRTEALGCLGCGERESPTIARILADALGYNLTICNACGRYLKEPAEDAALDPTVDRVLTAQLDAAAEARGLRL